MKKILSIIALAFVFCLVNTTYTYSASNNQNKKIERQIKRETRKIERLKERAQKEFQKRLEAEDEIARLEEKKGYILD